MDNDIAVHILDAEDFLTGIKLLLMKCFYGAVQILKRIVIILTCWVKWNASGMLLL